MRILRQAFLRKIVVSVEYLESSSIKMLEKQCLQGQNSQLVLTNHIHMQGVGGSGREHNKALPNFRCQPHDTELPYVKGEHSGRMEEIN